MTVRLIVIDINPYPPGVISETVSEYSLIIFLYTSAQLHSWETTPPIFLAVHLVVAKPAAIFHCCMQDKSSGKTLLKAKKLD